ncbi:hypothetical protein N328_01538, partial [Gavia stellata]
KQCSFFFLCFNSTSEMTTFFHSIKKNKSDINPVQLKRYLYKMFCKKKSSEELTYLNTP